MTFNLKKKQKVTFLQKKNKKWGASPEAPHFLAIYVGN